MGEVDCIIYTNPDSKSIYCTVERPILRRREKKKEITIKECNAQVHLIGPLVKDKKELLKLLETYGHRVSSGRDYSVNHLRLAAVLRQRQEKIKEWSSFFQTLPHPNVSVGELILQDLYAETEYKTKTQPSTYNKVFEHKFVGELMGKRHFLEAVVAVEHCKKQEVALFRMPTVLNVLIENRNCPSVNDIVDNLKEMCSHVTVDFNTVNTLADDLARGLNASLEALKQHPSAPR
jgi:hypothetical protein